MRKRISREMAATFAPGTARLKGALDDAVWRRAPVYPLTLAADKITAGESLSEGGTVKLAWNEHFLFVAVEFEDSDVVAEGTRDGEHHYAKGDVAEIFLKKNYPEAPYVPVIEILHTKDYVKDLFGKNYATKDPENPEKQEDALI